MDNELKKELEATLRNMSPSEIDDVVAFHAYHLELAKSFQKSADESGQVRKVPFAQTNQPVTTGNDLNCKCVNCERANRL